MLSRRLLLASAGLLATPAILRAQPAFRLTILHTNDIHSRHDPGNRAGATCRPQDAAGGICRGGSTRLAAAVAR